MSRAGGLCLKESMERVNADQEEAVVFLAKIISRKEKKRIRMSIAKDPEFAVKQHMFFGMNVRNALRAGGFFYDPITMDVIWFDWLKRAVCLPEDKIILTDSIKERIKKYRASIRRPPLRPKLDPSEVASIKKRLEKRHNMKLPDVDVRYSDNIKGALVIEAPKLPQWAWKHAFELKGLDDDELEGIDPYKFTIFLPKRYSNYPVGLYGVLWHEFGHVLACTLCVKDRTHSEGIAYACGFRGLLLEALEGKFSVEKAVEEIERQIKGVEGSFPFLPHRTALRVIKKYDVERGCFADLEVRNRDPEEFIAELDESILRAVKDDKDVRKIVAERQLANIEKPFVGILITVIVIMLILSIISNLI